MAGERYSKKRSCGFVLILCLCLFSAPIAAMAMGASEQSMQMLPGKNNYSYNTPLMMMQRPIQIPRRSWQLQLAQIFHNVGYKSLSRAIQQMEGLPEDGRTSIGPATFFAPNDAAFRKIAPQWTNLFTSQLMAYHTVKGIFSTPDLALLPNGTRLDSILAHHSLLVTTSTDDYLFVEGAEIVNPDMYIDRTFAIHGVGRFLFTAPPRQIRALEEVRILKKGYGVLAAALSRVIIPQMKALGFNQMTIFAPDDDSILAGAAQGFLNTVKYHVLPSRRLLYADLLRLPTGTTMETLVPRKFVVVTTNSTGAPVVSINNVALMNPDAFSTPSIVIHGISLPFPFPFL